jgi:DNA-binding CsgD family transcriptional regulator
MDRVLKTKGGLAEKRRCLLSSLCALVQADNWTWSLSRVGGTKNKSGYLDFLSGSRPKGKDIGRRLALGREMKGESSPDQVAGTQRIIAVHEISDEVASSIVIKRRGHRRAFSEREITAAQIILTENPWLHKSASRSKEPGKQLAPRQRATLLYLARGLSRKEIARRLGISPHTVHSYIKALYRRFRVHSRSSLMKQLVMANAGRTPA